MKKWYKFPITIYDKASYEAGLDGEEHAKAWHVYIDLNSISALRPDIDEEDKEVGTLLEGPGFEYLVKMPSKDIYKLLNIVDIEPTELN